ncbi:MAG: DsbA family protein [Anaerolineaceae bacterium]|nr:DsbA family protein [Anaerolineaceae bacterium]
MTEQKLTRKERITQAKRKKQMQSIGIIILGLLIIVTGFVLIGISKPKLAERPQFEYKMTDGNAIGNPNAPVVIEEFSSFMCSHCRDFSTGSLKPLIETYVYTGQVYLISRSFADPLGEAGIAAQAAYCAGEQGKFWEMKSTIFANFSNIGYSQKILSTMADMLSLDAGAYKQCMSSATFVDMITADLNDGSAAGITGTPSFLINGELAITGNKEFSFFQQQIEAALAAANN